MRIYTEVNFEWDEKQGKLVEVSSDSYDYNGEMAMCAKYWKIWKTVWYDDEGNAYRINAYKNDRKKNSIREAYIQKSSDGGATWDEKWMHTSIVKTPSETHEWFERRVAAKSKSGEAHGTYGSDDKGAAARSNWEATYPGIEWSSPETNARNIDFDGESNYKESTDDDGNLIYVESEGEYKGDKSPTELALEQTATTSIKDELDSWKDIIGEGEFDLYESEIDTYITDLKDAEQDVRDEYKDLFEEGGTLANIQDDWATATAQVQKDMFKGSRDITDTKEEGLKGTITTREESLSQLREGSKETIRTAEAKTAAAGFSSTGVGRTARDVLAEELGKGARDVDEAFTEDRAEIKKTYLQDIGDLKEKKGAGGSDFIDITKDRTRAADTAQKSWETATKTYNKLKSRLEGKIEKQTKLAEDKLLGIGSNILGIIETQQIVDESYDPFALGFEELEGYDPEDFGLSSTGGIYSYDIGFEEGLFKESSEGVAGSYVGYNPGDDLAGKLYKPGVTMPWEEGFGHGEAEVEDEGLLPWLNNK